MGRRGPTPIRVVGRYAMFDAIASGGMATVHFGRLRGPAGFSRTVAIKRLHAHYADDPEVSAMFLDEARVAARIRHSNVVTVIDVVEEGGEIFLVMDYVHGESLAYLLRADAGGRGAPRLGLVGNVMVSALQGLHAAHEATGENNRLLGVVHRDFSPHNILVDVDGVARVADFGVAKAAGQKHHTDAGKVKGKIRYLSPEQVTCGDIDRRADLWAASVVLWEALTGKRLFSGDHDAGVLLQVLQRPIPSPREIAPDVPEAVAELVMHGLERDRQRRFATALEMATALEAAVGLLPPRDVGAWALRLARGRLDERQRVLDDIEAVTRSGVPARPRAVTTTTDTAMVRVSTPEEARASVAEPPARRSRWAPRPLPRASWVAWGAAATLVAAIAGGVGSQLLARTPVRVEIARAVALPPDAVVAAALPLSAPASAPEPTEALPGGAASGSPPLASPEPAPPRALQRLAPGPSTAFAPRRAAASRSIRRATPSPGGSDRRAGSRSWISRREALDAGESRCRTAGKMDDLAPMTLLRPRLILLVLPLAQAACVESGVHEQTVQQLSEARHALSVKDTEIRAYQWHTATLAQQLHDAQLRSDALQRDLFTQVQQLATTNAALGERLKKVEAERASLLLASSSEPSTTGRDAKAGVRPEDLRRLIAAADARNALIGEELARIERLLAGGASGPALPAASPGALPPKSPASEGAATRDVVDPWGFGSRK